MRVDYKTSGVCARTIHFDINEGKVSNVSFVGGCDGNLKAISTLVDGWSAQEIADKLLGNTCGMKHTSCADQFAKAVLKAAEEEKEAN